MRNQNLHLALIVPILAAASWAQPSPGTTPGTMSVHWNQGAATCVAHTEPALQVHAYNLQTYILRESLCTTFEAPFMYLLLGSKQALLIDSGDVADPKIAPLADTVMHLLPGDGAARLPLLVVHTHRHLDHRAGDSQFAGLENVRVVGFDVASVRKFYGLTEWPNRTSQLDLGDRTVDVLPTPGHNETEVTFYDRSTGLLFSGDFLLPARMLIDDSKAFAASAQRLADFVRTRPVTYVLGGHIEMDANGELFPWQSQFHPNERVLQLTKDDVLALPAAFSHFNGFYTKVGSFVFMDSIRILIVFTIGVLVLLIALLWLVIRYVRRRRAARANRPNRHPLIA